MFCRMCGAKLPEDALVCPYCGTHAQENVTAAVPQSPTSEPTQNCGKAIAGFVLALVGAFLGALLIYAEGFIYALPCGILGLIFSLIGKKEIKEKNLKGKGLATAGLIISIVILAMVSLAFILILLVAVLSMFWFAL